MSVLVARMSHILLFVLCVGPIAAFPIGLAYKACMHLLGAG